MVYIIAIQSPITAFTTLREKIWGQCTKKGGKGGAHNPDSRLLAPHILIRKSVSWSLALSPCSQWLSPHLPSKRGEDAVQENE